MLTAGRWAVCEQSGFVFEHAGACVEVAKRTNSIILFREPGKMAQGLIKEGYCMKGFRIDTKSCDWGPMSGFVCVDPRLTKDPEYSVPTKNPAWTREALEGEINPKFFGRVQDPQWRADMLPIVLSQTRIDYLKTLEGRNKINFLQADDGYFGVSRQSKGNFEFHWRLISTDGANEWWLKDAAGEEHFVLCADNWSERPVLQYPENIQPMRYKQYETVLGLTNPGTRTRGFKACVTADYDLLSVWAGPVHTSGLRAAAASAPMDTMANQHRLQNQIQYLEQQVSYKAVNFFKKESPRNAYLDPLPGDVPRQAGIDTRPKQAGNFEHYRYGDISARILNIKVLLNSAIISRGYKGGNAVHHNDEVGNTVLAKGSLAKCLPIVAFLPKELELPSQTILISWEDDFRKFRDLCVDNGYSPRVKPNWIPRS